ncbi:MAG: enoyl-CoA hydratase-related protein [Pseudomonadota bacterium]
MTQETETEDTVVLEEVRGDALWLTINRQASGNALNNDVVKGLRNAIEAAQAHDTVRAVVITGAGDRIFCAGGDLSANNDGVPFDDEPAEPINPTASLFREMATCRIPIIARVNGHALAGGFGLMAYCHLAVASERAKFGVPEAKIGLFPMMIMPALMRSTPQRVLMELCLTGEPITAEKALSANIVNEVTPLDQLDAAIDSLIARISAASPTGIRVGLTAFNAMRDMSLVEALDYAQVMLPSMARTEDAREGFQAFREKRQPKWTGR